MKGADVRAGGGAEGDCPLAHLVGGFVGESYCANIVRLDARIDKRCDSIRDYAGFAAARAGNNKQRPFYVKDSFFLRAG